MRKNTKRALILSALSLLLCVSMLVGTTFAWFTDNATTSVNTIKAGTLDIQLVHPETGENMEGKTLDFKNVNGETDILWEPGATFYTDTVRIKNNSNLSININAQIAGYTGDTKLLEALEIKLVQADDMVDNAGKVLPFDQIPAAPLTDGMLQAEWWGLQADWTDETGEGVNQAKSLTDICVIAHMKEEAGNEYQGLTLTGTSVIIQAKQAAWEYDSYDNQYDKDAAYGAADNLYITEPGEYTIDLTKTNYIFKGEEIQDTLAAVKVDEGCSATIDGNGTVKINVTDASTSSAIAVWARNGGQIMIEDGTYIMERTEENHQEIELIYVSGSNSAITIKGGTFKSDHPRLTLNIHKNSNGTITVMGGTYWEFNPENAEDAGVIIPEGYKVVEEVKADGTWYTVVAE